MATQTRTDVHAPSSASFDPELYRCNGVFDLQSEWGNAGRGNLIRSLVEEGYTFGGSGKGGCGHCGANIRYAALMVRDDVHEMIYVGEQCLENRFESLTKAEFQALRVTAKLNRERTAKTARLAALYAANTDLVWASYADNITTGGLVDIDSDAYTLGDIHSRAVRSGELSENQLRFVTALVSGFTRRYDAAVTRAAAKAALAATGVAAPLGKGIQVEGIITFVDTYENDYGFATKGWVTTDAGWTVWTTIPRPVLDVAEQAIYDGTATDTLTFLKGQRIAFTATLEAKSSPTEAKATRPSKGRIVTTA